MSEMPARRVTKRSWRVWLARSSRPLARVLGSMSSLRARVNASSPSRSGCSPGRCCACRNTRHRTTLGQDPQSCGKPNWYAGTKCSTSASGGIVDEPRCNMARVPQTSLASLLHQFSRAYFRAALRFLGFHRPIGILAVGDHPLSQRLDRQPVTVLLHQLLTGQRGAKVGVATSPMISCHVGMPGRLPRCRETSPGGPSWRKRTTRRDLAISPRYRGLPLVTPFTTAAHAILPSPR